MPSLVFREVIIATLKQFASFKIFNVSKDLDNLDLAVKLSASLAPNLIQRYADLCLDIEIKARSIYIYIYISKVLWILAGNVLLSRV